MARNDDLSAILADSLNKKNKDQQVAYFLDDDSAPTNVNGWISTGCAMLDLAISNRPYGGIPIGKIIELNGLEQSGKSLLSAHILAETQKKDGVAVLIDTESSVSREFFEAIGVDISKLVYITADTVEEIFENIENIIEIVRKAQKDKPITIVVDSVAAASTLREMDSDYSKDGYATDKAIIISKALRKITNVISRQKISLIFTNQLRMKMNAAAFSDPWTTSGGKGIAFHASVRIRLAKAKKIKNADKQVVGVTAKAKIVKNRLGPPERECEFDIFFDSGIDDYGAWLSVAKKHKIIKTSGAWMTYTPIDPETGEIMEKLSFQTKNFIEIVESNPKVAEILYNQICDAVIMSYRTKGSVTLSDDLEFDEDE